MAEPHRLSVQHLEEIGEVRYGEWEGKKISKLARKPMWHAVQFFPCLLYTSDAADERSSVDLGGRRIIKKKKSQLHITIIINID